MKRRELIVVTCRCNESPAEESWEIGKQRNARSELQRSQEFVGGSIEVIPYPRHLNRPKLSVIVNGDGLQRNLPYNRWGLIENFYIVRYDQHGWEQSLPEKTVSGIIHELNTDLGYLDDRSGVHNYFREKGMDREPPSDPFFFLNTNWPSYFNEGRRRRSVPVDQFEAQGGEWKAAFQLHFTGRQDTEELRYIEELLDRYADHVEAHCIYFPLLGMYSVELQFGGSETDQEAMDECLQEYQDHFVDEEDG